MVDEGWADVVAWLPADVDVLAFGSGTLRRRRIVRKGEILLRLAMAYAVLDLSLRGVAAWSTARGIAKVSDVAVLKRLRSCVPFLARLLGSLLRWNLVEPPKIDLPLRVRIADATTVSAPGSEGADWRIHLGYDVAAAEFDTVEITDGRGGESLEREQVGPGDLMLIDRGYARVKDITEALDAGAHVLVRIGHSAVPLWDEKGERVDPLAFACRGRDHAGRPPRVEERPVYVLDDKGERRALRLVVVRKTVQAAERERRRARREARKDGRQVSERTLKAAAYTFLLSSVPATMASPSTLAELYRVRWQVELAFKRYKSLLDLDRLRAHDPQLALTYILSKLIAAALAERLAQAARAFSPWGFPIQAEAGQPVEARPVRGDRAPRRRGRRTATRPARKTTPGIPPRSLGRS
jgi:hypothetical protein